MVNAVGEFCTAGALLIGWVFLVGCAGGFVYIVGAVLYDHYRKDMAAEEKARQVLDHVKRSEQMQHYHRIIETELADELEDY